MRAYVHVHGLFCIVVILSLWYLLADESREFWYFYNNGFSGDPDLERVFRLPATTYIGGNDAALPLKEIIRRLEATNIRPCFNLHIFMFHSLHTLLVLWQ